VGGKLAEQYQETHCVRSLSKRTLWDENLIPLIITKFNLLQTRGQEHQSLKEKPIWEQPIETAKPANELQVIVTIASW
jgi:hypothetical protein